MDLFVRDVLGDEHHFEVMPDTTIGALRHNVAERLGLVECALKFDIAGVVHGDDEAKVRFGELTVAGGDVISLVVDRKSEALWRLKSLGKELNVTAARAAAATEGDSEVAALYVEAGIDGITTLQHALDAHYAETARAIMATEAWGDMAPTVPYSLNWGFFFKALQIDKHDFLVTVVSLGLHPKITRTNLYLRIPANSPHFTEYCALVRQIYLTGHSTDRQFEATLTYMCQHLPPYTLGAIQCLLDAHPQCAVNIGSITAAFSLGHLDIVDALAAHVGGIARTAPKDQLRHLMQCTPASHQQLTLSLLKKHHETAPLQAPVIAKLLKTSVAYLDYTSIAEFLVSIGADPSAAFPHVGSLCGLKYLEECGADINACDGSHATLLTKAVTFESKEMTEYLLSKGADCNIQMRGGSTALMIAARKRDPWFAEMLFAHGADPHKTTDAGFNAASAAAAAGNRDMAEFLQKEHNVSVTYPQHMSLPQINARAGCNELLTMLDSDEEMRYRDDEGRTALIHAAMRGNGSEALVKLYKKAGLLDARCNRGVTALGYAVGASHRVACYLLESGASTDTKAVVRGELVPLLCGAVSAPDINLVRNNTRFDLVELLVKKGQPMCVDTFRYYVANEAVCGMWAPDLTKLLNLSENMNKDERADVAFLVSEKMPGQLVFSMHHSCMLNTDANITKDRTNAKGESLTRVLINRGYGQAVQTMILHGFEHRKPANDGLTPLQAALLKKDDASVAAFTNQYSKYEFVSEVNELHRKGKMSDSLKDWALARC